MDDEDVKDEDSDFKMGDDDAIFGDDLPEGIVDDEDNYDPDNRFT